MRRSQPHVACSNTQAPHQAINETRNVVDEAGRTVTIPVKIERIVSLAPNLTEIVYAVGAGDRLVGNTTFCNYPAAAKNVAKVGDTLQPSIERILALRPQLVLVSTASQLEAFTKQLNEHQIAVYITDAGDLEGVFRSILSVGDLVNEPVAASELVKRLRERTESGRARSRRTSGSLGLFPIVRAAALHGRQNFICNKSNPARGRAIRDGGC